MHGVGEEEGWGADQDGPVLLQDVLVQGSKSGASLVQTRMACPSLSAAALMKLAEAIETRTPAPRPGGWIQGGGPQAPGLGRFKGKGFLREGGNRNPPSLKRLFGDFLAGQKVTRGPGPGRPRRWQVCEKPASGGGAADLKDDTAVLAPSVGCADSSPAGGAEEAARCLRGGESPLQSRLCRASSPARGALEKVPGGERPIILHD